MTTLLRSDNLDLSESNPRRAAGNLRPHKLNAFERLRQSVNQLVQIGGLAFKRMQ